MRISFLLNDFRLSGGTNVVLQHAKRLASLHGHSVTLLVRDGAIYPWVEELLSGLRVELWTDTPSQNCDVAIATYWETVPYLGSVDAASHIWFSQLLEDRFFPDRNPDLSSAQLVASIPVPVVTEAHWIADFLTFANPHRNVEVVLNGVDKEVFCSTEGLAAPHGRIRVLVEGPLQSISKNTEYAIESALGAGALDFVTHVGSTPYATQDSRYVFVPSGQSFSAMADLYRSHHILLKTSRVEGMFGPPLEAFHCGTPALVTPVTGAEEYIRDGVNAVIVPWDDTQRVSREINRVATEDGFWEILRQGALATAEAWPGWDQQASLFHDAIQKLSTAASLSQDDVRNVGETIGFAGILHWLAMRRLSDKEGNVRLVEAAWLQQEEGFNLWRNLPFRVLQSAFRRTRNIATRTRTPSRVP